MFRQRVGRLVSFKRFNHQNAFKAGDSVLVRPLSKVNTSWFIDALNTSNSLGTHRGKIPHTEIIGKEPRSIVYSYVKKQKKQQDDTEFEKDESTGSQISSEVHKDSVEASQDVKAVPFMITHPSFDEYIRLTKRDAQPIYGLDATVITHLADMNINYPNIIKVENESVTSDEYKLDKPPLQFLEAGTGHGSLTLTIARLLHPANAYAKLFNDNKLRGAILHTVDCNLTHSNRGKKTVQGYRHGQYYNNVEFHIAEGPSQWLTSNESLLWKQLYSTEDKKFLSGCFLDMPDPHLHIAQIANHLQTDAPLIVFQPSITQFLDIMNEINKSKGLIKLSKVKILELTPGIGAGMREWDLRANLLKAEKNEVASDKTCSVDDEKDLNDGDNISSSEENHSIVENQRIGITCRPKVGVKVMGGGFLGIFKKNPENGVLRDKSHLVKELV